MSPKDAFELQVEFIRKDRETPLALYLTGTAREKFLVQTEEDYCYAQRNLQAMRYSSAAERMVEEERLSTARELRALMVESNAVDDDAEASDAWKTFEDDSETMRLGMEAHLAHALLQRTQRLMKIDSSSAELIVQVALGFAHSVEGENFLANEAKLYAQAIGMESDTVLDRWELRTTAVDNLCTVLEAVRGKPILGYEGNA